MTEVGLENLTDWATDIVERLGYLGVAMLGAWTLYAFSAAVGPVRVRAIIIRYGTWIGFGEADLDRAEAWFDRRSRSAVLLCRCVPLIRSLISIPAGFRRMPLATFTIFTLLGSLVWNSIMIVTGSVLGDQWEKVLDYTEPFQNIVMALIVVIVVALVVRKLVLTKRTRAAEELAHPGLAHETLDEIVEELEAQAEHDPVLRSELHAD